jgi:hypothetical protein
MADVSEVGSEAGGPASEASIFGESQPPDAAPQVVLASEHAQNHPFHSGTTGGRGRGRGRGGAARGARGARGGGASGASGAAASGASTATGHAPAAGASNNTAIIVPDEVTPSFGPISLRELEFAQRRNADGAESSVWSDEDENEDDGARKRKRKRSKRPSADADDPSRARRPPVDADDGDAMAAAAFGVGGGTEAGDDDDDDDEGEEGEEGDAESSIGDGARLLPIRGESCVGCVCDRAIIGVVDKFVRENAVSMTETALYKAAALHYRQEVVIPRRREGVRVLPWQWKSIQAHYVLHVCDPLLQRAAAVRSLGAVRAVQEQSLMKINTDGTKQLDQKGAELLLKIIQLQEKQLTALDSSRMPPPPSRAPGGQR